MQLEKKVPDICFRLFTFKICQQPLTCGLVFRYPAVDDSSNVDPICRDHLVERKGELRNPLPNDFVLGFIVSFDLTCHHSHVLHAAQNTEKEGEKKNLIDREEIKKKPTDKEEKKKLLTKRGEKKKNLLNKRERKEEKDY